MEKLQAALSRAREKRESESGQAFRPSMTARERSRNLIQTEAMSARWGEIAMLEPSAKSMRNARIYANEVSEEAQYFDNFAHQVVSGNAPQWLDAHCSYFGYRGMWKDNHVL